MSRKENQQPLSEFIIGLGPIVGSNSEFETAILDEINDRMKDESLEQIFEGITSQNLNYFIAEIRNSELKALLHQIIMKKYEQEAILRDFLYSYQTAMIIERIQNDE